MSSSLPDTLRFFLIMLNLKGYIVILFLLLVSGTAFAQTNATTEEEPVVTKTIVETIVEESNGNVTIEMPEDIIKSLSKQSNSKFTKGGKSAGYRILVFFDGRNQHSLERRAKSRAATIVRRFPKYSKQVYHRSKAPNWLTHIGNFKSHDDAEKALKELRSAFPSFANEMMIVTSEIELKK